MWPPPVKEKRDSADSLWIGALRREETGFHHVGQAGLKLLTSNDLPALASQNAVITSVSHRTRPELRLFYLCSPVQFMQHHNDSVFSSLKWCCDS
ncbi:hypothetical protein AAY473_026330 [Plecturocebus cupreus]